MATNNNLEVVAGKPLSTGGVLVGPIATAAPTNASTALVAGFTALGYVGDDGLTETNDRSSDKVRAWGGDTVKVLQTDFSATYAFTLLQSTNTDVLKLVYGASNVTTTAATASTGTLNAVKVVGDQLPIQSFVFEVKDGTSRIRIYVPRGQVTETGEITYNDGAVIGYSVTVEAFADATGVKAYKYIDNGITV